METAEAAHVAGDSLVKSVVVKGDGHYAIVLLPATHRVRLASLHEYLGQPCDLANEREIRTLFKDCEVGSIPPFGHTLLGLGDVYFEAGDHEELVHVSGEHFGKLMTNAKRGHFGRHV